MKKTILNNLFNQSILEYGLSAYIYFIGNGKNYKPNHYETPKFNSGYMVSLDGYEHTIPLKKFTPKDIKNYIEKYGDELNDGGWNMLGIWINKGKVYLDISRHYTFIYNALDALKVHHQKAFYDIGKGKSYDALLNVVE